MAYQQIKHVSFQSDKTDDSVELTVPEGMSHQMPLDHFYHHQYIDLNAVQYPPQSTYHPTRGVDGNYTHQAPYNAQGSATSHSVRTSQASSQEKPKQHGWLRRPRFFNASLWALEIIGLAIAVSAVSSIVAILAYYDGKPLPAWPFFITINAVIAILATIATAAMGVPLSSGLGQLKWIRFKQGHAPLTDMEMFDEASRGPLGAMNLLLRARGGLAGSLGASIMVTVLLLGPFCQQIASYPLRTISSPVGAINLRAFEYMAALPSEISKTGYIPILPLKAAAYNGLFAENGKPWTSLPITCETGNCTWNPFDTLAVCYSCIDMSEYMTRYCPSGTSSKGGMSHCGWSLPSGATLNSSDDVFSMTSLFPGSSADASYSTIMKLIFMGTESQNGKPGDVQPWAKQCTLNACVQTISSFVVNGALNETVTDQVLNTTVPEASHTSSLQPVIINRQAENGTDVSYIFGMTAMLGMQSWFADLFTNGTATRNAEAINRTVSVSPGSPNVVVNLTVGISSGTTFFDNDIVQAFYWNYYEYPNGLEMLMHDLATSITVSIRSGTDMVNGLALSTESFVHVRWGFIAVPCLAVVLTAVFLAVAIHKTWKTRTSLWKSSALAVLFHGLDEDVRDKFADLDGLGAKKKEAKGVKVKLDDGESGGGLLSLDRVY